MTNILYTTLAFDCFFSLPINITLPKGDYVVRTLDGAERAVNAAAIAPFEITLAQAKQYLEGQMSEPIEALNRLVRHYQAICAAEAHARGETPITEIPEGNAEAAKEKLTPFVEALGDFLRQATSENPADQAAAQEKIRSFRDNLSQIGVPTSDDLKRIPERLRQDDLDTIYKENQQSLTNAFQKLFDAIATAANTASQELGEHRETPLSKDNKPQN
ncbi:MAG: hypothetical protein JXA21_27350 [Anaerolineae bacterium]|nr:hypothetical protein [Anaerolineae bacterium]